MFLGLIGLLGVAAGVGGTLVFSNAAQETASAAEKLAITAAIGVGLYYAFKHSKQLGLS